LLARRSLTSLTVCDPAFREVVLQAAEEDRTNKTHFIWTPEIVTILSLASHLRDVDLEGSYIVGSLRASAVLDALSHCPNLTWVRLFLAPLFVLDCCAAEQQQQQEASWEQDLTGAHLGRLCASNRIAKAQRDPAIRQPLLLLALADRNFPQTLTCCAGGTAFDPEADARRILDILGHCRDHTLDLAMAVHWETACRLLNHLSGIRHSSRAKIGVVFYMTSLGQVAIEVLSNIQLAENIHHSRTTQEDEPPSSPALVPLVYVRFC